MNVLPKNPFEVDVDPFIDIGNCSKLFDEYTTDKSKLFQKLAMKLKNNSDDDHESDTDIFKTNPIFITSSRKEYLRDALKCSGNKKFNNEIIRINKENTGVGLAIFNNGGKRKTKMRKTKRRKTKRRKM